MHSGTCSLLGNGGTPRRFDTLMADGIGTFARSLATAVITKPRV